MGRPKKKPGLRDFGSKQRLRKNPVPKPKGKPRLNALKDYAGKPRPRRNPGKTVLENKSGSGNFRRLDLNQQKTRRWRDMPVSERLNANLKLQEFYHAELEKATSSKNQKSAEHAYKKIQELEEDLKRIKIELRKKVR